MKKLLLLSLLFILGLSANAQSPNLEQHRNERKAVIAQRMANIRQRNAARKAAGESNIYIGKRKALVILVEYSNVAFQKDNTVDFFKKVCNEPNFSERGFKGSVRDYFLAQSDKQFDLSFDVVGVCKLKQPRSYYSGNNEANGYQMVTEACEWAKTQGVDFSQYDWDGDGYVEEVFVLYSGDGTSKDAIVPYMSYMSWDNYSKYADGLEVADGLYVDQYACGCELYTGGRVSGIGSFCHEFSHCMGFPDIYGDYTGMGTYDIMDYGLYNGGEFQPVGYSAWEKAQCGWMTLTDMTDITTKVDVKNLKAISDGGDAYIIRNKGHRDESYVVEYRRNTGSDAAINNSGVMISHIDYDEDVWYYNIPNSNESYYKEVNGTWKAEVNDHPRYAMVAADNDRTLNGNPMYNGLTNKNFNKTSTPAATLYNANADGTKFLHVAVNNILVDHNGGTASMSFVPDGYTEPTDPDQPITGDAVFYESFDKCNGMGGNDNSWTTPSTYPAANPDNAGWTASAGANLRGANKCLWFEGVKGKAATLTSPEFALDGEATLQFMAGALTGRANGNSLTLSANDGVTFGETSFSMESGKWTTFTTKLKANGTVKLSFTNAKGSFFIDEVKVVKSSSTGISDIYNNVDGQQAVGFYTVGGTKLSKPQRGINIVRFADGSTRKMIY